MTDLERMLIEHACEKLTMQYCHFVDHGEAARIADLFTADGVWTSRDNTMTGQDAIRRGFQKRQDNTARMSRHVCSTCVIDVIDADHAAGVVYLTLYRKDGEPGRRTSPAQAPSMVGEYRDAFRRTPEGWRISRREIAISFISPES
ncbi:hypothetical protein GC169_01075 [bacterium]|nr:hypothetical protein [bacterium]